MWYSCETPSVLKSLFFFSTRLFQAESFHGPETPRVSNDHKNRYKDAFQVKKILFHFTIFNISLTLHDTKGFSHPKVKALA